MKGHLDNYLVSDTPFPCFHESSLGMRHISASSSNSISVSLSLTNSPEMFPIRGPRFCRIKVEVQSVMWPLTLDLSVCKVITQGWRSICSVALCFEEETPGWSGEGLSPQPAHTAEHTWTQPGYN